MIRIIDTNVLVRAMVGDDVHQSGVAQAELAAAGAIVLAIPVLCELAWVLSRRYKVPSAEIAAGIRRLIDSADVRLNRPAAEAGLALLETGGDFADGAIAFEGSSLGGEAFVSFDRDAIGLLQMRGQATRLLT